MTSGASVTGRRIHPLWIVVAAFLVWVTWDAIADYLSTERARRDAQNRAQAAKESVKDLQARCGGAPEASAAYGALFPDGQYVVKTTMEVQDVAERARRVFTGRPHLFVSRVHDVSGGSGRARIHLADSRIFFPFYVVLRVSDAVADEVAKYRTSSPLHSWAFVARIKSVKVVLPRSPDEMAGFQLEGDAVDYVSCGCTMWGRDLSH